MKDKPQRDHRCSLCTADGAVCGALDFTKSYPYKKLQCHMCIEVLDHCLVCLSLREVLPSLEHDK